MHTDARSIAHNRQPDTQCPCLAGGQMPRERWVGGADACEAQRTGRRSSAKLRSLGGMSRLHELRVGGDL